MKDKGTDKCFVTPALCGGLEARLRVLSTHMTAGRPSGCPHKAGMTEFFWERGRLFSVATLLLAALLFLFPARAYAAGCSNPTGVAGNMVYNSNTGAHVLEYCDGNLWQAMGPVPGSGGSGCTVPTGVEGSVIFNATYGVPEYCDGTKWVAMAPVTGTLSFLAQTGVVLNATVTSNTIVVTGGVSNETATCGSGCTDIIRNGADCSCTSLPGFNTGDTIAIKQVASGSYGTLTTATVSVGAVSSLPWNVTTVQNAGSFSFTATTGAATSTTITSGNASPGPSWSGGGSLAVACGAGCTDLIVNGVDCSCTSGVSMTSGQSLAIKQMSSASNGTLTTANVTVGTQSGSWQVTTANTAGAFSFTGVNNQPLSTSITSNAVALSWSGGGTLTATCGTGCTDIIRNGVDCTCTQLSGFGSTDTIAIKQNSSGSNGTATTATVTVGTTTSSVWTVTTQVNVNAFSFTATTNAAVSTTITSPNASPAPSWTGGGSMAVTCGSGCTDLIINGVDCSCTSSTMTSGQSLAIKQLSSASHSTLTTASVTVGNTTESWNVTTNAGGPEIIYLTSGTSWTVPADWDTNANSHNTIEAIGSGGNGSSSAGGGGGGGGGYAKITNFSTTAGSVIPIQVGTAGGSSNTWFSNATVLNAGFGVTGVVSSGGAGGSGNVGATLTRNGGTGGAGSSSCVAGGGGGGAGGPSNTGGSGGGAGGTDCSGGGGGGANSASNGASASSTAGGKGGNGSGGTGGGAGGGVVTAGSPGTSGGGGGGGGDAANGGAGSIDTTWDATHGAGGGGGGAGDGQHGGNGGTYGGGGGGSGNAGTQGTGGGGLIIITYTP